MGLTGVSTFLVPAALFAAGKKPPAGRRIDFIVPTGREFPAGHGGEYAHWHPRAAEGRGKDG